ncbi:MAG: hypothetical protein M3412_06190 [Chloroflexota bacterium]|jgi:hypothetical protein|nr:hypothetical protein [Chloroflexota bacterium]
MTSKPNEALQAVADERIRQNLLWGVQRHSWPEWMCILTEEIGEAAQNANQLHWESGKTAIQLATLREELREELVQSAAVIVAMIEHLDEIAATGPNEPFFEADGPQPGRDRPLPLLAQPRPSPEPQTQVLTGHRLVSYHRFGHQTVSHTGPMRIGLKCA